MAENNSDEKPKIIVDSDWKEEARREKEDLDRETHEMPTSSQLPEPSVAELIQMIIIQASIGLGGFQDPQTNQRIPPNLPTAKHYVDLLELFGAKTKGNLDENEQALLESTLHELRLAFVQAAGAQPQEEPQA